ncbi:MAG: DnaJ domain-containing protein [Deltaproteobacteria bacterium]|nr:DnaJ domain-containing protein [Deltaproteobacteria bacterium]
MAEKDYYQILGVSSTAGDDEIKKAYRKLAKQHHPDVNKGDKGSEDKFKDISAAYDTLSDKKKREEYDMMRKYGGMGGGGFRPNADSYTYRGRPGGGFENSTFTGPGGENVQYEFNDLGDIFGDLFGMGGVKQPGRGGGKTFGGGKGRAAPIRGADRTYSMEIDFLDSVRGTTTKISLDAGGKMEKINVKIPPGVKTGSKIRLAGKGEPSSNQGPAGDLYIEIKVRPHPYFTREDDDILLQVPVALGEAVNGATIEVPTVDGSKLKMKIPAGTQGGQKFRLKGKGVPHRDGSGTGDQYVVVQIELPPKLDEESRNLIEEFSKRNPYQPREKLF